MKFRRAFLFHVVAFFRLYFNILWPYLILSIGVAQENTTEAIVLRVGIFILVITLLALFRVMKIPRLSFNKSSNLNSFYVILSVQLTKTHPIVTSYLFVYAAIAALGIVSDIGKFHIIFDDDNSSSTTVSVKDLLLITMIYGVLNLCPSFLLPRDSKYSIPTSFCYIPFAKVENLSEVVPRVMNKQFVSFQFLDALFKDSRTVLLEIQCMCAIVHAHQSETLSEISQYQAFSHFPWRYFLDGDAEPESADLVDLHNW